MVEKILEVCKVTPPLRSSPSSSPSDGISLPLTFLDLRCLMFPAEENLFCYEAPHNSNYGQQQDHDIIHNLKNSLSLTLQHFLPVAGNLVWPLSSPKPFIQYKKGDGVLLTIARSEENHVFDLLTSKDIRECRIFQPLIARLVGSEQSQVPIFVAKVTLFPNKNICLGITTNHSLFDYKSVALFMNSWASISKFGSLDSKLVPNFDRKSFRERYAEAEGLGVEILKRYGVNLNMCVFQPVPAPDVLRGTFKLSDSDVAKLKEIVRVRLNNNFGEHNNIVSYNISTFTVTYAYTILCFAKTKGLTNNDKIHFSFPFECRNRIEPRLSENYFGNCVGVCDKFLNAQDVLGKDGLSMVVDSISKSIKKLEHGALEEAEKWAADRLELVADEGTMRIFATGTSRSELDDVDFGWGRPKKVENVSIHRSEGISFTRDDQGIEINISSTKGEMEKFASIFAEGLSMIRQKSMSAL